MSLGGGFALVVNTYPLPSYTFGTKDVIGKPKTKAPKDSSAPSSDDPTFDARFSGLRSRYQEEGLVRTAYGVILAHDHTHPVVFALRRKPGSLKETSDCPEYSLPGGRLNPGEDEISGLSRLLTEFLSPPQGSGEPSLQWEVREPVATWWRPNFEPRVYPFCPPHCTRPVECMRLWLVSLPETAKFAVPKSKASLVAVPFFDLLDNPGKWGQVLSSLPQVLSRFNVVFH